MGGEEVGGAFDVAGAEAELAGSEVGLGGGGELGPGREGVRETITILVKVGGRWVGVFVTYYVTNFWGDRERGAVALGEEGEHLFDLDDLLGGAAEEGEEGFAEGLAEDAQAGVTGEACGEVGVAGCGQSRGDGGGAVVVKAEVVA